MHEHLVLGFAGWECDAKGDPYDRRALVHICVEAMEELKPHGVKTLVDATPSDLGRDAELQKEVSERSGINIICATGLYMEALGAAAYYKLRSQTFDTATEIYESFMEEITHGIRDTGVRAGVIKVATGHGVISPYEEKVLSAAARAQKETGVPIITHTEAGTMGPEQADLLISEGADPKRIMIGHMGGSTNLQYHVSVLEKGVYTAFDRLGLEFLASDVLRKASIIGLIGIGYVNRIMLSHDYWVCSLGRPLYMSDFAKSLPANRSYTHVFRNIIPALKEAGITDEKINMMMVENPRRLFAGE